MEKVREEEEQLKKLYQRRSKKYKPFGFESKFKLSFLIFFKKREVSLAFPTPQDTPQTLTGSWYFSPGKDGQRAGRGGLRQKPTEAT